MVSCSCFSSLYLRYLVPSNAGLITHEAEVVVPARAMSSTSDQRPVTPAMRETSSRLRVRCDLRDVQAADSAVIGRGGLGALREPFPFGRWRGTRGISITVAVRLLGMGRWPQRRLFAPFLRGQLLVFRESSGLSDLEDTGLESIASRIAKTLWMTELYDSFG